MAKHMTKKTMMMGLFLLGLTACGGSGGGGASTSTSGVSISGGALPMNFRTLSFIDSEYGVALKEDREAGEDILFYSGDIRSIVNNNNASSSGEDVLGDPRDFESYTVRSTTGNTRIREGTFTTSDGFTFNIEVVEDIRNTGLDDTGILYMSESSIKFYLISSGGAAYLNPPTGSYTYTGAQMTSSGDRSTLGTPGSFRMTVNFSTGNFQYDGTSEGVNVDSSGNLDVSTGRFDSTSLTVTESGSDYSCCSSGSDGNLHGLLHGDGATATTGIFYTKESGSSSPKYSGSFVGSRN